ncbi:MAG: hypothetical protein NTW85_06430 [Methylococcales bacterium]|nr:hypothetical protein [Methylococcales bacterium]
MTKQAILAGLVARGSNFRQFALAHGYDPRTVPKVVARYADTDRKPRGIQTYAILRDLSTLLGEPVIDGLEQIL